jgi:signal transduction histidine kinase
MRTKIFDAHPPRWLYTVVWVLFGIYVLGTVTLAWTLDRRGMRLVQDGVDHQLRIAVSLVEHMTPPGLVERAAQPSGVPLEEDIQRTAEATRVCMNAGVTYLYALQRQSDGVIRHIWSSDDATEIEKGQATWFWKPYEKVPSSLVAAFNGTDGMLFQSYTDEFGTFRSAFQAQVDPATGQRWVLAADLAISELNRRTDEMHMHVLFGVIGCIVFGLVLASGLHLVLRRLSKASRDLELLAEIAHATGHAVLLAEPSGVVRWANSAAAHHLGIDSGTAIGRRLEEILLTLGPPDPGGIGALLQSSAGGSIELPGPGKPGATWLLADIRPVSPNGQAPWRVCLLRDLSDRHAIEAALRLAQREAQATAHAKAAFLANMSHEIRTPLNGVLGMINLLIGDGLNPQQREMAEVAGRSAEALLTILNDVLDFSKIEAGHMSVVNTPCDVEVVARDVVALFRPSIDRSRVAIEFRCEPAGPVWVRSDALRLRQVLSNLVSNAAKFTEHGRIEVALEWQRTGDRVGVRLNVADTGIGIPADRQGILFQPFTQADDGTNRRYGGTGLGLAITKRLVEMLGGTIAMTSEVGKGTTLSITLDLQGAAPPDSQEASGGNPLPIRRDLRALLVDPASISRNAISLQLRALGIAQVVDAEDANAASHKLLETRYDLLLVEHQLVADVVGSWRRAEVLITSASRDAGQVVPRALPIIAIGAGMLDADRAACLEAGCDDVVAKPVSTGVLRRIIARWCVA